MKNRLTLLTCVAIFIFSQLRSQDRLSGKSFSTRSEVMATHGMAATSNPLATQMPLRS